MKYFTALAILSSLGTAAMAQPASSGEKKAETPATEPAASSRSTNVATAPRTVVDPRAQTLSKMMKVVSADFTENTVEQCMNFIRDVSGADFEILWTEGSSAGLDKEKTITLSAKNVTLLTLLENVLDKASDPTPSGLPGATWQMTSGGALQLGLKSTLNRLKRLETYDINDMLFEVKDKTDVPELDLQASFQGGGGGRGGGGGGGQSPFGGSGGRGQRQQQQADPQRREKLSDEVKKLIVALVETDQWADNSGDGGTITYWQGTLLINAPDYMHRQIDGYPWWGSGSTSAGAARGGRYVSLDADVQRSSYDKIRQLPVTGATGGGGR